MTDHAAPTHGPTIDSGLSASGGTSASSSAQTRRRILFACAAVGLWVLVSFVGTMLDPARAPLWTRSLMWSLLASLLVSPALLVTHPASGLEAAGAVNSEEAVSDEMVSNEAISEGPTAETGEEAAAEATPFVGKGARLWPEPGELRERADLRRKAAAFEEAAFQDADADRRTVAA